MAQNKKDQHQAADADLVTRCLAGDKVAFAALIDRHRPRLELESDCHPCSVGGCVPEFHRLVLLRGIGLPRYRRHRPPARPFPPGEEASCALRAWVRHPGRVPPSPRCCPTHLPQGHRERHRRTAERPRAASGPPLLHRDSPAPRRRA